MINNNNTELDITNGNLDITDIDSSKDVLLKECDTAKGNLQLKTEVIPYPKIKIMLSYSLLGGMLGSVFSFIGLTIDQFQIPYFQRPHFKDIFLFGVIFGSIPAFLTGWFIASEAIYIRNYKDYVIIFFCGFLNTFIGGFFMIALTSLIIFLILMVIGGLSALVIGYFVVPKAEN